MNKSLKILLILIVIITFNGCKKETSILENKGTKNIVDVEYPTFSIEEYNKMDSYVINKVIDNINYKITYYFDKDMCVNSKEELTFKKEAEAKKFYDENVNNVEYQHFELKGTKVSLYYMPEYFEYMMYPKDVLIELLNTVEIDE